MTHGEWIKCQNSDNTVVVYCNVLIGQYYTGILLY